MQNKKLKDHIDTLKKEVFFTDSKWPHFNLLSRRPRMTLGLVRSMS